MNYVRKTDEEVKRLASDLYGGRIFCDRFLTEPNDLPMVFPLLGLMSTEQLQGILDVLGDHGMVYEYLSEAGERSVNGYPCFLSAKFLDSDDAVRVLETTQRIAKAVEAATG